MPTPISSYAATSSSSPLAPHEIERRDVWASDVKIDIIYCGICHSDIHQARNEWGSTTYPIVPWHEMVGRVVEVWADVTKHAPWDLVGVGCLVDSCRSCDCCKKWMESYCSNWYTGTYNGADKISGWVTYGWYAKQIVVTEDFVLKVSEDLPLEWVAPLLCAGITTYSPLKHRGIGPWHKVWVVWLGWLWHMAVKFASSFWAEVTVMSRSPEKQADAKTLGAHHFVLTTDQSAVDELAWSFDFIVNTVSAEHDYNTYLQMLTVDGTLICLWAPPSPAKIGMFNLIMKRRRIAWSLIWWLAETQEMLDYCAEHNIVADVEVVNASYINEAYERVLQGDVKYRFVIDISTL